MVTFEYTFGTISVVLKNGGSMRFKDLAEELMQRDPSRFRDESIIEFAVRNYAHCLTFDGGIVKFNKGAGRYAKQSIMERDVQMALHGETDDMEKWQIYPLKTRKNSETCYLNIPWREIPKDSDEEKYNLSYPPTCDFRVNGKDCCRAGCGVSEEILKKYSIF